MAQQPKKNSEKNSSIVIDDDDLPLTLQDKNSSKVSTPTDKKKRPISNKASSRSSLNKDVLSNDKVDDLQQKYNDERRENQILRAKLDKYEEERKKKV